MRERKLGSFCLLFLLLSFLCVHLGGEYFLEECKVHEIERQIPPGEQVRFTGRLYQKEETSDSQILYLKNSSVTYQNQSITEFQIMIYDDNNHPNLKIGNTICGTGSLSFFKGASNPGNFDQKSYYKRKNIHASIWAEQFTVVDEQTNVFQNYIYECRRDWIQYLKETAGEKNGGILAAMLLGDKKSMDPEIKELYQINGIAHILAISGLHLSFIGHGFYQFVRKRTGSYLIGGAAGLLFMALYIVMIGMSVSAFRAVVMFVMRVGADMSGRVYDPLTSISLAAVLIILWRPLSYYEAGFQLSFGAVGGILFLSPKMISKESGGHFLWNALIANVAVQIVTFPMLLYHFFEYPLYSIALNLIVVPLVSVILFLGLLSICLQTIWLFPANFFLQGCEWILEGYEILCKWILEIPGTRLITGQPSYGGIIGYYCCLALFFVFLTRGKKKRRYQAGIWMILGIILLFISCPRFQRKGLEVTMLDVGQGDCFCLMDEEWT